MDQTQMQPMQRQPIMRPMNRDQVAPPKKAGWFKWVLIILLILIIGGLAWYILTP